MKNRITLIEKSGCWIAKHSGPDAARVRELMGTDEIPTPYRAGYPADILLAKIRMLNKDREVVLG